MQLLLFPIYSQTPMLTIYTKNQNMKHTHVTHKSWSPVNYLYLTLFPTFKLELEPFHCCQAVLSTVLIHSHLLLCKEREININSFISRKIVTFWVNRRVKNGMRYFKSSRIKPLMLLFMKLTSYSSSVSSDRCSASIV